MSKSPTDMEPDSLPTSQGVSKVVEKGTSSLERTLTEDGLSDGGGSRSGSKGSVGNMVAKWKRGRPRKNGGVTMTYVLSPSSPDPPYLSQINWSTKRCRGRPRGSGRMRDSSSLGGLPAETSGADFIPHVVTVHTGEDVVGKIFSFSERDSRAICILSANGVVSSVKLCQPCSIGATMTYEGRFQILTLSGSLTFIERDGALVRNGTLSVTLANPDGRVFGGSVAGALTAASPIQLVLASFTQTDTKELSSGSSAGPVTALSFPIDSALDAVPISFARPE